MEKIAKESGDAQPQPRPDHATDQNPDQNDERNDHGESQPAI